MTAITIDSTQDIMVTGGRDKYVRVYDFRTNCLYHGPIAPGWITSLAYVPSHGCVGEQGEVDGGS